MRSAKTSANRAAKEWLASLNPVPQNANDLDKVLFDLFPLLLKLEELIQNTVVGRFLVNPEFTPFERKDALEKILLSCGFQERATAVIAKFIISQFSSVKRVSKAMSLFRTVLLTWGNSYNGTIMVSSTLSRDRVIAMEELFSRKFGKRVSLTQRVDESIVGGLSVDLAGKTFDASLSRNIKSFMNQVRSSVTQ